jgi:hypothetical protein
VGDGVVGGGVAGLVGAVDVADGAGLPAIGAAGPSTRCTPSPQAATSRTTAAVAIREIRIVMTSLCALSLGAMRPFTVEFGADGNRAITE